MKNIYWIPITLFILLIYVSYDVYTDENKIKKELPISLPEEISEAKPGDKLIVLSVSDSIYLGFSNKLQEEIIDLVNEGYTLKAAEHIAKVEAGIIKTDNEYFGLKED